MNKTELKNLLLQKEKEYLSELVLMLLYKLDDEKRMDFTAKYINAKVVLSELGKLESDDFLSEVNDFCEACLDGEYYVEAYYDDYSDSYDESEFEDSDWAKEFAKYFRLSVVHARNGDFKMAYLALDNLFECINKASDDYEILGTGQPLEYIKIDVSDTLEAFFESALKYHKNSISAYEKIFETWLDFRRYFAADMSIYITNFSVSLKALENNARCLGFAKSEQIYLLVKKIHEDKGAEFNGVAVSSKLVEYDPNYSLYLAQGYYDIKQWDKAVDTVLKYITLVGTTGTNANYYQRHDHNSVSYKLKTILVDSYEQSGQTEDSYTAALEMFKSYKWFLLYKRARFLAKKIMNITNFVDKTEKWLENQKSDAYSGRDNKLLLRKILSFEGRRDKLIQIAPQDLKNVQWGAYGSDDSYEYIKYTATSLIFASLGNSGIGAKKNTDEISGAGIDYGLKNLSEFMAKIKCENNEGISDMFLFEKDSANQERYLSSAVDMLRKMIQFHIDGAQRKSYTKAAYYAGIEEDVCEVLGKSDDYIQSLMKENNRRPAFKEEMRKVFKNI
ncbi:MAG: hypothetical protein FWD23_05520 [Oscillospiraceae bacterium]|nr:hypothetical protein [Oscillospiraceae bacterium]